MNGAAHFLGATRQPRQIVVHRLRRQVAPQDGFGLGGLALKTQCQCQILTYLKRCSRLGCGAAQIVFSLDQITSAHAGNGHIGQDFRLIG